MRQRVVIDTHLIVTHLFLANMAVSRNDAIDALDRQVGESRSARASPPLVLAVPATVDAAISLEKVFEIISFICKCVPTSCTHLFTTQEIRSA